MKRRNYDYKAPKSPLVPTITASDLSKYLHAYGSKRFALIYKHKFPNEAAMNYYGPARGYIKRVLLRGLSEFEAIKFELTLDLDKAIATAALKGNDYHIVRAQSNQEAVFAFVDSIYPQLTSLNNFKAIPVLGGLGPQFINGTFVTLEPDYHITFGKRKLRCGYLKLNFERNECPTPESLADFALLMKASATKVEKALTVHPEACLIAHVPTGLLVHAPNFDKKRLKEVGACCSEIRGHWPLIEERKSAG